jgi:uncharacterized membrane protein
MKQSIPSHSYLRHLMHLVYWALTEPFRLPTGKIEKAPMYFSYLAMLVWAMRLLWVSSHTDEMTLGFDSSDYSFVYGYSIYLFLPWNLFLAWIPFLLVRSLRADQSGWFFWPMMGIWLLFFPNAPYLITDFIHFGAGFTSPFWLELLLFGSFSLAGISLGCYALLYIHESLHRRYDYRVGWVFIPLLLLLASIGIFLGRVSRFNSWDAFVEPSTILLHLVELANDPGQLRFFTFFSVVCFGFLLLCYVLVYYQRHGRITSGTL